MARWLLSLMLQHVSFLTRDVVMLMASRACTQHAMEVRMLLAFPMVLVLTEELSALVALAAEMSSAARMRQSLACPFLGRSLMTPSIGIGSPANLSILVHRCLRRPRPRLPLSTTATVASLLPHTWTLLMLATASLNRPV